MPTSPQIVKFRQLRRDKRRHHLAGKFGLVIGVLASLLIMLGVFAGIIAYSNLTSDLPSLESIPARLEPPGGSWLQPTRLYDRSGEHVILTLQHPAAQGKRYLTVTAGEAQPGDFASSLVQATVAALEPSFWDGSGYSWDGLGTGESHTLAQRMVRELLLSAELPSIRRDIRERILAGQLINRYGHARVLAFYLNSASYGPLIYGADAASLVYFGKSASDLSIAEAAWLAAASESAHIDLLSAPQLVFDRQQQIIAQMLLQGLITPQQASQATSQELSFHPSESQNGLFFAFTNQVISQIKAALPDLQFERGGVQIITTLDYDLQLQAACALETQLRRLQADYGEVLTADGTPCAAARLLPTLSYAAQPGASGLAASLVVLDPGTSQVLAMVGQEQPGLDPALQPGQPAGTLLTPFIYLSAFVRGFSPASLIWEVPGEAPLPETMQVSAGIETPARQEWTYHGPVRLRTALANDYLAAAAQLYQRVGAENVWQTAYQFGMTSLAERPVGAGTFTAYLVEEAPLLESVHAYAVFSNLGMQTGQKPSSAEQNGGTDSLTSVSVIRVVDSSGEVLLDWSRPQSRPIVTPQLAYLVTHVLSDEAARWPSLGHPNPLEIGRPAGARLSASLDGSQSYTLGFIPQLVVGTWLGFPEPGDQVVPQLASAALWHAVIKYAAQDLPVEDWTMPSGITRLAVCDPSGLLPTPACPVVVDEVFLAGNEPLQADNLYQLLRVNRETGLLATVFTPSELVDEKVFLVVPASAEPWAEGAGLQVPPQGYDPIYLAEQASPDVNMTAPAMFAHVRGNVILRGTAAGPDFDYYRIQVGQGLNPTQWLVVGEDGQRPVNNGRLGVWDTTGLQGLYVVQLSVVHTDQRVDSQVLQVTVDNNPPQVAIMDPSIDQVFMQHAVETILLQAAASDDLVLDRLEFYLDGELFLTLWQPPYAALWAPSPGLHTLLVRAYDLAGNRSEQMVEFEVRP